MSLQIVVGAASSGKSNQLITDLTERSLRLPEEKFFIIVPEQATLNMQLNVVKHLQMQGAKGTPVLKTAATMNIDVVSFDRLAHVVFADLGIDAANILDDTGKVLILRQVLEDCKEDLAVYQSKVHQSGFAQRIKSQVTELKQYGIDDNLLYLMQESAETSGNRLLYAKLQDLRLITRKFNEKIKDAYRSAEELLALFADCVSKSERIKNSHIYLDGFTGFTPVQYRLLEQFLRYANDVNVTITVPEERICGNCPEYDLFYLSNQTYIKLIETAAAAGTEVLPVIDVKEADAENRRSCKIFPASDQKEEVLFTAKEILRLVRDEAYRFREIAVITSDMEAYHEKIESLFAEAGIPCFIDHKSGITDNPLSRYMLSALGLMEQRFSYESVFTYLKTGLTDLSMDDICIMENYCLEFGIKGIRPWYEDMEHNKKLYGADPGEEALAEDPFAGQEWDLDEINRIRKAVLDDVRTFYRDISHKDMAVGDYVDALVRQLQRNHIREKIDLKAGALKEQGRLKEQREYEQVYDLLMNLLEKTKLLSGEKALSVKDFRLLLESGISEIKVGVIPPTMDTLMVGDLTRTRLDHVKVIFLLGANNGRIPSASEPAGVFSARDREFLKTERFELAPTATENMYNQRFYLYLMLNKPTEQLYITYASTGEDGEEMEPSYIIDELPELLKGLDQAGEICYLDSLPDIKWKMQALRELSAEMRKDPEESLMRFFAAEDPFVLKQILDAAYFSNAQTALDPQVALDLYGDVLSGSVSRYEKFSECPFKHFLSYGIRLEKRPEYEIAATDVGTIYHAALEKYSGALEAAGYTYRNVPEEVSHSLAEESVEQALSEMPSDVMDSSSRNEFFVKRITDVTVKTTDVLRAQVKAGLYEPDAYELEFRDALGEGVRFKGKIDRVDIYDADDVYVKIIDYKSGKKEFKLADIYSGLQLQLVAYLKEAISHYEELHPDKQVKPGGVYYYRINDQFAKDETEAGERFKLSGLTSCEEGMIQAVDTGLAPGASSLIVPVKLNNDGTPAKTAAVANSGEFRHLMDFVGEKIESISSEIKAGNIEIHPYYEQDRSNACVYCEFRDVCKFDAGNFGTDWKEKTQKTKAEMEAEVYGRV
ncbi:MAG: exodeoxyribonuclease V subunit gamma [Lachnospiraceae bacterium]|nr:exodeoxyribonuclease V subunit gamma [Lachnospiraceae bacterium]